jgi:hypothetical protein
MTGGDPVGERLRIGSLTQAETDDPGVKNYENYLNYGKSSHLTSFHLGQLESAPI